jgi:hypothetical protein
MGSASLAILRDMLVPTGAPDLVAWLHAAFRPSMRSGRFRVRLGAPTGVSASPFRAKEATLWPDLCLAESSSS